MTARSPRCARAPQSGEGAEAAIGAAQPQRRRLPRPLAPLTAARPSARPRNRLPSLPLRIPVFIDTVTHVLALIFAMYLQRVVAMVVSGLRGGYLGAEAAIRFSNESKYTDINMDTSLIDEAAGMALALAGMAFQIWQGFGLPFPLNLLLLPVVVFEYVLQWQVLFAL